MFLYVILLWALLQSQFMIFFEEYVHWKLCLNNLSQEKSCIVATLLLRYNARSYIVFTILLQDENEKLHGELATLKGKYHELEYVAENHFQLIIKRNKIKILNRIKKISCWISSVFKGYSKLEPPPPPPQFKWGVG